MMGIQKLACAAVAAAFLSATPTSGAQPSNQAPVTQTQVTDGFAPPLGAGLPYVEQQNVGGLWQGVDLYDPRVFVMDLRNARKSRIVMALPPSSIAFAVSSVKVEKEGMVVVEASNGVTRLILRGRGRRAADSGIIEAQVELRPDATTDPTMFKVDLRLNKPEYFSLLKRALAQAERALAAP